MNPTETLELYIKKARKVFKTIDHLINGDEKQLVLEIGNHTIKVVEYIVKEKTIEVTGGATLNTPVNVIQNDRLVNNDTLANVLAQTLKQEKIKTKEFVVSIVSKEIITREMNVPNMRESELKSFVQINSNDIFPVKLVNYVLAYNIIERGEKNRVMIAAIPKDIVESYIELANKLELKLKGINYSGYELYNFLDFEIDSINETYLAVDVGARNTNVVIISKGVLKFNKIIPKGSHETSKYISQTFGCSLTKAEQLKRQHNTIELYEGQDEESEEYIVAKYTRVCVDNILQDLVRIMEFFNTNNSKNRISKVYVVGVVGKIKGIEEYISDKLNIPTKALKLFDKVNFNKNSLKLKPKQHSFINCFGAHQLKFRKFYLIKGGLKFEKLSLILKPKFHKLAICALLVLGVIIAFQNSRIVDLRDKITMYDNFKQAHMGAVSLQYDVKENQGILDSQIQLLENIKPGIESQVNVISEIEAAIESIETNAFISVTRYKYQKGILEIRGRIELPLGIDRTSMEYSKYINLPFEVEAKVEAALGKEITITSSNSGTSNSEFVLKIEV